jgi:branched-subunit amino acid ABC-type transport system permease component
MGLLITAVGSVFLVGGLLQTIGANDSPQLFPPSINQLWSSPYGFLGFSFTILGIILFLVGLILAVHYAAHRSWYGNALKERYRLEEEELKTQRKSQGKNPNIIVKKDLV